MTPHCNLLIRAGLLVTMNDARETLSDAVVAIRDDRIVAVGGAGEMSQWEADRVVDLPRSVVLPGLVDGHNHLFQALARGLGEGEPIWPWLCNFMWPYAIAMRPEDARAAARLGAVEAIRAGTTTVIDNHYAPTDLQTTLAVTDAMTEVGLRGAVARGILGRRSEIGVRRQQPEALYRYDTEEELEITAEAMRLRPVDSQVAVWPGPVNLSYLDQDLVTRSVTLAREGGTRWHTHCSEGAKDPDSYLDEYGVRPVTWLAKEGFLDERATLAHAIWLDDEELDLIATAGAGIAHNPTSNAYLASGTIRLQQMLSRGITVALGTDGPSCGHRQDLFECMKQAIFAQRLSTLDPTALKAPGALDLATRNGAAYAGIDTGQIAPGRLADLIAVDLDQAHLQPVHDPAATLAYSTRGSDVSMTVIAGRIVFEDGRVLTVDESQVIAEATQRAEELMRRTGLVRPAQN